MTIHGIPVHPLVVHAAVVVAPVAALVSLVYAFSARHRARLHSAALLLALAGAVAIGVAWYTGRQLLRARHYLVEGGSPVAQLVHTHQHRANWLALVTLGYAVLALASWVTRAEPAGRVVRPLLAVAAVAVLAVSVLAGDAGARAVWG